jgi:hypothetical protein
VPDACEFIKPGGTRCRFPLVNGDRFCINHSTDPRIIQKKAAACRKGGRIRTKPDRVGEWTSRSIETTEDLRIGLAEAFDQCMLGKVSTSQLSALSQAAAVLLRLLDPPRPDDQGDPNSLRDHVLEFIEKDHPELKADFVAHLREKDADRK